MRHLTDRVKTIVIWKLDRLSRRLRDGINTLADWCEKNIKIVVITQQIELSGAVDPAPLCKPKKWGAFAKEVHTCLFADGGPLDVLDWGFGHTDGRPRFRTPSRRWNNYFSGELDCYPPERLSKAKVQAHLDGFAKLYVKPNPFAKTVMVMLDADAHHGEPDAAELARWVVDTYFLGSYSEASQRGHHAYPKLHRDGMSLARFNRLLDRAQTALVALCKVRGFMASVELRGNFTVFTGKPWPSKRKAYRRRRIADSGRGTLMAMPRFPARSIDLHRLRMAPTFGPADLRKVIADAKHLLPKPRKALHRQTHSRTKYVYLGVDAREPDGFKLANKLCKDLALQLGRAPSGDELHAEYDRLCGLSENPGERARRCRKVAQYHAARFNSQRLGGFAAHEPELLALVGRFCQPDTYRFERVMERGPRRGEVVAEDWSTAVTEPMLAVGLSLIQNGLLFLPAPS